MAITHVNATPNSQTSVSQTHDDLKSLRDQIIANAGVLYPHVMTNSRTYQTTGFVLPCQLFEIIVAGSNNNMRAILVYGEFPGKKAAAKGPVAGTAEAALQGLLDVTSEALGWYTDTLLGEMEHQEPCSNGMVDLNMVEAGYHHAASQRWAQENHH